LTCVNEHRRAVPSLRQSVVTSRIVRCHHARPSKTAMKQGRNLPAFVLMDTLRRAQGHALAMFGLGPTECEYRVLASGSHWRLREYAGPDTRTSLLIVAAPIKRPYIWDLAPSVSAVRYCLQHRLRAYLLEWVTPSLGDANNGLDEHAEAIAECIERVAKETSGKRTLLIGHSLGGTLAAISAALQPEKVRGLALLGAPLCFQRGTSQFADAVASMDPSTLFEAGVVPGSFLSQVSAVASPETFIWSRLTDAALSIADTAAMDIHARVERWALDEAQLPSKLVYQIFQWLYRENRLCRGTLVVAGKIIGPSNVDVPTIAIVNTADEIAPLASVKPFLDAMPCRDVKLIEYPGETGVALQHVGILVGRNAYKRVWPVIVHWLESRH
jgi:polyhydroxyalkanoate synthase